MKKIFSIIIVALLATTVMAQAQRARERMIVNMGGKTMVYDVSRLDSITFDQVQPVNVALELVSTAGYSVKVRTTMPADCSHYLVAAIPAGEPVADKAQYIRDHASYDMTESKELEVGGLLPTTDYLIATLAFDRYNMPSEVTTLSVTTIEASDSELPKVGYILYADGSWSRRMVKGRKPVGIIFSTTTSEADQAKGWSHGYALALRDAASEIKWANTLGDNQAGEHYTSADSLGFQTDKDGYQHTQTLIGQGTGLYPAADAAVAYATTAPMRSSGWYLPSSGQWYDICVNLGGMPAQMPRQGKTEGYWNDPQCVTSCLNRINEYLSLTGADNYAPIKVATGDYIWYWASSESSSQQAYAMFFNQDELVVEIAGYFKNYGFSTNRVRSVIAF